MTKIYTTLLFSSVLFSCGLHINYLGTTSAPTQKVDVFVDPAAIKRPFTVVGKGYADRAFGDNTKNLQPKAVRMAMEKGADAILFQDLYVTEDKSTVYTSVRKTDSSGRSSVLLRNSSSSPIVNSKVDILFLKYD
ncbi:MAG TPA: hypothetical protein VNR87_12600 [Flavisolibacter sp.]|nr:hypothetical protein [Flavisolibacter sp.]